MKVLIFLFVVGTCQVTWKGKSGKWLVIFGHNSGIFDSQHKLAVGSFLEWHTDWLPVFGQSGRSEPMKLDGNFTTRQSGPQTIHFGPFESPTLI